MNTASATIDTPSAQLGRRVLQTEGLACSLLALAPGQRTTLNDPLSTPEHILFVIEGGVTVCYDGLTFPVKKDDAVHIPAGKENTIVGGSSGWSKVLRIDFAPRQIVEAPLYSFPDA